MYFGFDTGADDKTIVGLWDGGNISLVTPPEWAGDVVNIMVHKGELIVACRHGVFRMRDGSLYPLRFIEVA